MLSIFRIGTLIVKHCYKCYVKNQSNNYEGASFFAFNISSGEAVKCSPFLSKVTDNPFVVKKYYIANFERIYDCVDR